MKEGVNMLYILLLLIGIKFNMGALYWTIYGIWITSGPFMYCFKQNLFKNLSETNK